MEDWVGLSQRFHPFTLPLIHSSTHPLIHSSTLPAFHSLVRAFACVWESGTFGFRGPPLIESLKSKTI
jgi:hypothetical protein